MIKYTVKHMYGAKDYIIYENEEEAKQNDIVAVRLEEAGPNDYVKSDNGYYVPVYKKQDFWAYKHTSKNVRFIILYMPGYVYKNTLYGNSGNFRRKPFIWRQDGRLEEKRSKFLSAREVLFAQLIGNGIDITAAYSHVFKRQSDAGRNMSHMLQILSKPQFINYLKENGYMENLKRQFEIVGLNGKWLGEQLKLLVEDKSTAPQLKSFAINCIMSVLDFAPDTDLMKYSTSKRLYRKISNETYSPENSELKRLLESETKDFSVVNVT